MPLITCYPPLGQVTQTTPDVVFSCVLNVDDPNESWQVLLRYSPLGCDDWEDKELTRSGSSHFQSEKSGSGQLSFRGSINITTATRFEISFRQPGETWVITGHESIILPDIHLDEKSRNLGGYMKNLNPNLQSNLLDHGSQSGVMSWMVKTPVAAAQGDVPHMEQVMFGKPFGGEFLRWFGIARNTTSWMSPRQGRSYFKLDVAAILCSFLNTQGQHLVALGASGFEHVMTIFGDNNEGDMMIKIRNDREAPGYGRVIVAVGNDFESTLRCAAEQARSIFVGNVQLTTPSNSANIHWADHWMNGLIYSSNSKQSEEQIVDSLSRLAEKGISVSTLMLSDWQAVDQNRPAGMIDFEASPTFGPGLKQTIAKIKSQHESTRSFIVSHPIFGHWGGISDTPRKPIQKYETISVQRSDIIQPDSPKVTLTHAVVSPRDIGRFYHDYYQFLSSCGVDAVQVDGLYMIESLTSAAMRCSLAEPYLDAQAAASLAAGALISMSLSPNALFNSLKLPRARQVVRNSAIFTEHKKHVFVNASNALLSSSFGNIPDWGPVHDAQADAFQLAARCISGGPVQIASLGLNPDLVRQTYGETARGKNVVLRPTGIGRTMSPYVAFEDHVLLKIANVCANGEWDISVLGVFNTSNSSISELLCLKDFPAVRPATEYVVCSSSGAISTQMRDDGLVSVSLDVEAYDILFAYPLETIGNTHVTTLGLKGKMIGAASIIHSSAFATSHGTLCIKAVVKALGVLEFYISDLSGRLINDNTCKVKIQGKLFAASDVVMTLANRVMGLDLETLWKREHIESDTDEIYVEVELQEGEVAFGGNALVGHVA